MAETGRPTKLTPDTVRKLEEVFAIDGTVEEACFYAEISRDTYYTWIKANPSLSDRFEALRNRPILKARQAVVKGLDDKEFALKYLSKKKKDEFSDRIEQTGADGKDLSVTIVNYGNHDTSQIQPETISNTNISSDR